MPLVSVHSLTRSSKPWAKHWAAFAWRSEKKYEADRQLVAAFNKYKVYNKDGTGEGGELPTCGFLLEKLNYQYHDANGLD